MLVLGRKRGETIVIDDDVRVKIVSVDPYTGYVHLGFDAPVNRRILREEIWKKINANMDAIHHSKKTS